MDIRQILSDLGIKDTNSGVMIGGRNLGSGPSMDSISPTDGKKIASLSTATESDYEEVMEATGKAFVEWGKWSAPERGEIVRQFGDALREKKESLGALVSYEMGKSYQEGLGEVQEMIDICDFALGQSRTLGVVGIISAFNFPVAVWCWNTALAWVSGDVCVWKPSEKAPLCSIACQNIWVEVAKANNVPEGVSCVVNGDYKVGEMLSNDKRVPLISATGSTRMGKLVAQAVAARLGRSLLELGGNNALIITPDADLKVVVPAAVFGAVGTCGQRCTSTRRIIIHSSVYDKVKDQLTQAYKQVRIGDPLDENNHVGPLIDQGAVDGYLAALSDVESQGGKVLVPGGVLEGAGYESGCYVRPAIAEVTNDMQIVQNETFAPILYIMKYETIEDAIAIQNGVVQGLSSAIMTNNLREAELFLSAIGSDCGIANVNIGTSGAEIGGAFGGEKETGGGRESGSDAWKAYMRRQTNTINYGKDLPLAQGIKFEL